MKTALIALLAFPGILLAQGQGGLPSQPYLYVQGRGEIEKPADLVTLRFELVERGPDQAKVNGEIQTKAAKIFGMLDERKIARADVIAGDLRSEPQYQTEPNQPNDRGKVVGYVITRPFSVKVRRIDAFPKLVDDLLAIEGMQFSGIEPGLEKEKELDDQLWAKALDDARTRAEKTLKPLGMKIASVFAVSPVGFLEIPGQMFGSGQPMMRMASEAAPAPPTGEYRLQPITRSQSVNVIYLITPAK